MDKHPTPASLLERLRQPAAEGAWARFVELYTPLLYFWACRMRLQAADAADLVQDVFTSLLEKLPQFRYDQHKSFRAWLRAVAVNKWRDNRRRRDAQLAHAADAPVPEVAVAAEAEALWEAEYHQHLVGRAVELMQAEFPPHVWRACLEFVVSGRPAAEVAANLGISIDMVYAAKSRVLRRLRQELDGLLS
jgi:RNA polymerase sigma-70 factor (ECF subfamily)